MYTFSEVDRRLCTTLQPLGFECSSFKIGWYNEHVNQSFKLDYPDDTLAYIVVSTPVMFDKAFKPFVCRTECTGVRDPIDECVAHQFTEIKEHFPNTRIECIHDFEMHHNRRPKVLVQTAGDVAGAAKYYQRKDLTEDPWPSEKKIFGVSVHPKYGGWFALRGVMIFTELQVPELEKKEAPDVLPENDKKIEVLRRFNECWEDWTFRDIIPAIDKYSEEQKEYFATKPKDRLRLLDGIRQCQDKERNQSP